MITFLVTVKCERRRRCWALTNLIRRASPFGTDRCVDWLAAPPAARCVARTRRTGRPAAERPPHDIEDAGLDDIVGILPISARSFTHITMVIFDTEAAKLRYGEYRSHLDFMDLASEQYSFNHHADRRFCETIKDAVDPQGILSPGNQGIWPAAMRPDRSSEA